MNWMAPYGNILTIIAPLPLYKPRKPSFLGTARSVASTPEGGKESSLTSWPAAQSPGCCNEQLGALWLPWRPCLTHPDAYSGDSELEGGSSPCRGVRCWIWHNIQQHLAMETSRSLQVCTGRPNSLTERPLYRSPNILSRKATNGFVNIPCF